MTKCERCGQETNTTIMSMFNTQIICMKCLEKEKKHPKYEKAKKLNMRLLKKATTIMKVLDYKYLNQ